MGLTTSRKLDDKATANGTLTMREALKSNNLLIVDVRSPSEFSSDGGYPGAINISSNDFSTHLLKLGDSKDRPIAMYCRSGMRSNSCMQIAHKNGYINCFSFTNKNEISSIISKL